MIDQTTEWKNLLLHQKDISQTTIGELFNSDSLRSNKFSIESSDFLLDYSKNIINDETMSLLIKLAKARGVEQKTLEMYQGKKINETENRSVLHIALRDRNGKISPSAQAKLANDELSRMSEFCNAIHSGKLKSYKNSKFKKIINIGIGGSHLGPQMAVHALSSFKMSGIEVEFISNVDNFNLATVLENAIAEETLFLIASKTFTTNETMKNAIEAKKWISHHLGKEAIESHFVAISTNLEEVNNFGIKTENTFQFWDWVGGRFSISSAIGLSLMLSIGVKNFESFLDGMHEMDIHFKEEAPENNMPITLALLEIWYVNFFNLQTKAVVPYSEALSYFPNYLQQLQMESNGKSINTKAQRINWNTSPVIWGSSGTNGQHAYFQHLHQGTQITPIEFIGFSKAQYKLAEANHNILMANLFAQSSALAFGDQDDNQNSEEISAYKTFNGNRPSTTLLIKELTPHSLGKLISLYEHKTFVQGIIWDIFSFDQFGVELGKKLSKKILPIIEGKESKIDASTKLLIDFYKKK